MLVGWLAGPSALKMQTWSNSKILETALDSLVYIFNASKALIKKEVIAGKVINWINDPFSCGAYSYATVESKNARKKINIPVEDTIFFSGEALDKDETIGTVEAALVSGRAAADKIIKASNN